MWTDDGTDVRLDWGPQLTLQRVTGCGVYGSVFEGAWSDDNEDDETRLCAKLVAPAVIASDVGLPLMVRELMLGGLACSARREVLCFKDDGMAVCLPQPVCTLHDLTMGGNLPLDVIVELGRQLLTRIADIHEQRVVHGNLTPRAVIVLWPHEERWPQLHIIDFGMSKLAGSNGEVWSARYRAPEVLMGQAGGPAADVWAAGAILWHWATGTYLTTRASADDALAELCVRFGSGDELGSAWGVARPDAAPLLQEVLHAALRMDPAKRHSPAQLLDMRPFRGAAGAYTTRPSASSTDAWLHRRRAWWCRPWSARAPSRPPLVQYHLRHEVLVRVSVLCAERDEAAYVASKHALTKITSEQLCVLARAAQTLDLGQSLQSIAVVLVDRAMQSQQAAGAAGTAARHHEPAALVGAALFIVGSCYAAHGPLAVGDVVTAVGARDAESVTRAVHAVMREAGFRLVSPAAYAALRALPAWARIAAGLSSTQ